MRNDRQPFAVVVLAGAPAGLFQFLGGAPAHPGIREGIRSARDFYPQLRSWFLRGMERKRLPVILKTALRIAGGICGIASSPAPVIQRLVFMNAMVTCFGYSFMRDTGNLSKLRSTARPSWSVVA